MNHGILSLPVLPIRSEPSERAEMTTQLLFGEQVEILEVHENWLLVRNQADGYEGWATEKMLTKVSEESLKTLNQQKSLLLRDPITVFQSVDSGVLHLPAGSRLFIKNKHFLTPLNTEIFPEKEIEKLAYTKALPDRILQTAYQFVNAPYLWGGKTIFGIDCSGLTQVAASVNGFQIPRDACDQALLGEEEFLSLSLPGDLAFFANSEGRIVHVGIVCGQNKILHASGSVHVDDLDEQGIYSRELKTYTHRLHSIKRIFYS
ncbi:MAG TPA: C40 family peptidase [Bacteroidales bacterium]|nr:C40 family peptidase [Bacteroidales bacterium]